MAVATHGRRHGSLVTILTTHSTTLREPPAGAAGSMPGRSVPNTYFDGSLMHRYRFARISSLIVLIALIVGTRAAGAADNASVAGVVVDALGGRVAGAG